MTTTPAVRDPRGRGWGYRLTAAASVVLGLAAAGCANSNNSSTPSVGDAPTAVALSTAAGCHKVSYPLVGIPRRTPGEPIMQIPKPPGWEVVPIDEGDQSARFELANPALTANETAPNAVVVLRSEPGHRPAQSIFDDARSELINMGFNEVQSESNAATVCGQPAEIGEYTTTMEGMSYSVFTKLLMVVAEAENETYIAALFVGTTEPDNPIYQRDSQAIFDGFLFFPPDSP
ncbi:MAG: LpqN/LpqT family lipoprotein [Actinomycetia bacterium]|nr:LpqN/LpqT family lipoprotein [Actinomycetes bacterium]